MRDQNTAETPELIANANLEIWGGSNGNYALITRGGKTIATGTQPQVMAEAWRLTAERLATRIGNARRALA